ncbi:uncharacterized protein [Halyomorpha halys]|uniref:uncharacterized protein n=1 Tax=Halyomorpha halys TaxID=286706 RepID=UPI0034D315C1
MVSTRPDLANAVGVVVRSLENPTVDDFSKVKRIFQYLKGAQDLGISYQKGQNKGYLTCYSDADPEKDVTTGRSTTDIVRLYSSGVLSWISQRQVSVAISITEVEIISDSEVTQEIVWLK